MSLFLYRLPFTLLFLFRLRFPFLFPFLFLFRIPVSGFSRCLIERRIMCNNYKQKLLFIQNISPILIG